MEFDNSQVEERSSILPIEGGVPNCRLVDIKQSTTKDGFKSLDFTFKEVKTGSVITDKIFEPIDKTATPPYPDYDFKAEFNKIVGRIKHIQGRYMSGDAVNAVKGSDWTAFCNNVIASFPAGYKEIPCSLDIIYNNNSKDGKEYINLRSYPPFVSTEAYPKVFSPKMNKGESYTPHKSEGTSTPGEKAASGAAPVSESEI